MACLEYSGLAQFKYKYPKHNSDEERLGSPDHTTFQEISLAEEIYLLRSRMEQLVLQEKSFTSEVVIEISSLLDLKINAYMKSYYINIH